MVYADPRRSLGIISSLFSGYTISFFGTCIWRTEGRCCRNFARIGVEHDNQPQLRILSGVIRTYLNLLEMVDIV